MRFYVNFKDETKEEISNVFLSPQDPRWYKNLGEVEAEDERLKKLLESFPQGNAPLMLEGN